VEVLHQTIASYPEDIDSMQVVLILMVCGTGAAHCCFTNLRPEDAPWGRKLVEIGAPTSVFTDNQPRCFHDGMEFFFGYKLLCSISFDFELPRDLCRCADNLNKYHYIGIVMNIVLYIYAILYSRELRKNFGTYGTL
jgi:hypothetical protein